MNDEKRAYEELKKGISNAITSSIDKAKFTKIEIGYVDSVGTKCGYKVKINNTYYDNIPYLNTISTGDIVVIVFPNNNTSNMFILGKLNY